MGISTLSLQGGFEAIIEALDRDGTVIVEDFISQDLVQLLNTQLDNDVMTRSEGSQAGGPDMADFHGSHTKRVSRLVSRAPAFADLLDHDLMHRWAKHDLDGDYWLNTGQAMWVGPGQKAQALHRDLASWPVIVGAGPQGPDVLVEILLALSDFTVENGATRVVPGSHKWPDFERPAKDEDAVSAVMKAGSAVLYRGKTIHGAGSNTTQGEWRRGLHMSFVVGWLTPEEAVPLGTDWQTAQQFSERVQRMLGFASPRFGEGLSPRCWMIDFEDLRLYYGQDFERPTEVYGGTLGLLATGAGDV